MLFMYIFNCSGNAVKIDNIVYLYSVQYKNKNILRESEIYLF